MKWIASLTLLWSVGRAVDAFVVQRGCGASPNTNAVGIVSGTSTTIRTTSRQSSPSALWMTVTEEGEENNVDTEARAEESVQEEQPQEEEPAEDPELVAIKEEIAQLESTLKDKRRELAYVSDKAEEYSKSGYARKVAEMENMRRARSMLASSNKSGAMAGVLTSFLPILDSLGDLHAKYGADDFGKSYNALFGSMRQVYTDLGATEYTVATGDKVDMIRMNVIEKVHSAEHPANTVIQPLTMGWELQGNVIRAAECVASLGPETVEEPTSEQPAPQEEEEDEPLE